MSLITMCRFVQTDMGNKGARYYGLQCATMTVEESADAIITQVSIGLSLRFKSVADSIHSDRRNTESNNFRAIS